MTGRDDILAAFHTFFHKHVPVQLGQLVPAEETAKVSGNPEATLPLGDSGCSRNSYLQPSWIHQAHPVSS